MDDPFGLKLFLLAFLVFVPVERLFALRPEQKVFRAGLANDLVFMLFNSVLVKLGLVAIIVATVSASSWIIPSSIQAMVSGFPFWVQLPLIILLSDLGVYWTHRMFHAVPQLWKFHAIHHSAEELDWLAAVRVHPVDQIITKGVSLFPVFALGFSEGAIGVYALIFYWQAFFIHSNTRIKFGPARYLIASPEFHHWHHSSDQEARDKNFAAQLSFLDALFGSLHLPRGRTPTAYGLDHPMPPRYLQMLFYPFVKKAAGKPEMIRDNTKGAEPEYVVRHLV